MKKYISLGVAVALLISPVFASAQTISSLQAEIQSLLSQIATLQAQGTANVSGSTSGSNSESCINLTFFGGIGTTGNQVSSLQTFLGINPSTGYFGTKTQVALAAWQSAHDVSATGYFGVLTRGAMACGNNGGTQTVTSSNTENFIATPTSGAAPLQVTFTMKGSTVAFNTFDFGDGAVFSVGAANSFDNVSCSAAGQDTVCQGTHTYTQPGSYIARIADSSGNSLGTATITVTGSSASQPSASIDQSSLAQSSSNFTISGSATNAQKVSVDVAGFGSTPPSQAGYITFTTNVGGANVVSIGTIVPVVNGRWSVPFQGIGSGAYTIHVRDADTASTLQQLLQSALAPLATGVLTVGSGSTPSSPPSATIDQNSLNPALGSYAITGEAYNTNAVIVASVHSNYSGSTDYNSVSAFVAQNPGVAFFQPEPVLTNHWSVNVVTLNPALVATILVYDASTHTLLTTGTLTINSTASSSATAPTCTLAASGYTPSPYTSVPGQIYVKPGSSVTLTWTSQNATLTTSNFSNGSGATSGSLTIGGLAAATNVYTVTAYNSAGNSGSCSATVYVDQKG